MYSAVALLGLLAATAGAQPSNDQCAGAQIISGAGSFAFDNTAATTQATSNLCSENRSGADVWFLWTATVTGIARFDTCGSPATFDTTLDMWPTCSSGERACNDNSACGVRSQMLVNAIANQQYLIRVAGKNAANPARGSGVLTVTEGLAFSTGDDCSTAIVISGAGPWSIDNRAATNDSIDSCGVPNVRDVWFRWTAPFTGIAVFETCGPVADTRGALTLFSGTCESPTEIDCARGDCAGFGSRFLTPIVSGTDYLVRFANASFNIPGTATLRIRQQLPSPNDLCGNATPVGEGEFAIAATIADSLELPVDSCAFNTPNVDVWFRYTPTQSGRAIFSTCTDSNPDFSRENLTLYSDCSGATLLGNDCETCGLGAYMGSEVTQDQDVLVRVSNTRGGAGTLKIFFPPAPANDNCANAEELSITDDGAIYTTTFDVSGADTSRSDSCGGGVNDVWFSFIAPSTGFVELSTCDSNNIGESQGIDSVVITAYDSCSPAASELACDFRFCQRFGRIIIPVTQDASYRVRVAARGDQPVGIGNLSARYVNIPSNDNCIDAAEAVVGQNIAVIDGSSNDEPRCLGTGDVWFRFTSPVRTGVFITDCGIGAFDVTYSIFQGCGGPEIACTPATSSITFFDCPSGGFGDYKSFIAQANSDYYIRVATRIGTQGDASGTPFVLGLAPCTIFEPPSNATPEIELCGQDLNGGCNASPPSNIPLSLGQTYVGTSFFNGALRDTDWYRVVLDTDTTLRVRADAEFPMRLTIAVPPCPGFFEAQFFTVRECGTVDDILDLSAGEYWFVVAHEFTENGVPLPPTGCADPNRYWLSVAVPCDTIDFNNNGVFPEDQDVIDFFDVLAGGSPNTCDPIQGCNTIDFNNNGVFPEDQDVIDFFNVLAGGECP